MCLLSTFKKERSDFFSDIRQYEFLTGKWWIHWLPYFHWLVFISTFQFLMLWLIYSQTTFMCTPCLSLQYTFPHTIHSNTPTPPASDCTNTSLHHPFSFCFSLPASPPWTVSSASCFINTKKHNKHFGFFSPAIASTAREPHVDEARCKCLSLPKQSKPV